MCVKFLYDTFDYLPEVTQQPIIALLVILVGYFLSKIFAALLSAIIPEKEGLDAPITQGSVPSRRGRIILSCFWVSWLVFFIVGFIQLPLLSSAIKLWVIELANLGVQFLIILGGGLLLVMDKTVARLNELIRNFFRYISLPKPNGVVRFMLRALWIPLVVIGGSALNDPQTVGLKVSATLVVLLLGYLLGNVVKVAAASLLGLYATASHLVPKFFFYCVCVTFFMTAISIWV